MSKIDPLDALFKWVIISLIIILVGAAICGWAGIIMIIFK
jgi:hypothetical protein